ncbi:MAG: hypothetical protein H6Q13_2634 [Bacteroidetes bacterium]|nr:hypothetical protein [Bacteroidota bacterium]
MTIPLYFRVFWQLNNNNKLRAINFKSHLRLLNGEILNIKYLQYMKMKTKIIAFYLPQYYPIPENDEWWGKGFTEWTNVGKARSLFKGHYQPKVPADLGYYDLRLPIIREQQVELAKEAGVYGFCYWHYWFGNGKRLMSDVFEDVLNTGKPDFPFCLAWANHSWYAKNWNTDGTKGKDKLLCEQTYPGIDDVKMHFQFLCKAFKDERYIKVDGRPLLVIFDPLSLPDYYIKMLQSLSRKEGFSDGLYLVGNLNSPQLPKEDFIRGGYDAVTYQRLANIMYNNSSNYRKLWYRIVAGIKRSIFHYPVFLSDYQNIYKYLINKDVDSQNDVIPAILPNWDHTPRSGMKGSLFINSTPDLFKKHVEMALSIVKNKPDSRRFIFLKSWNEWGEGNYMEPDLKYGKGYIKALNEALNEFECNQ